MSIPLAILRIIGYILLCIFYTKLYFAMKFQTQAVVAISDEQAQPTKGNERLIMRQKKQSQHVKKFFIGITTSFFVFNLPSTVASFVTNQFPNCKTWQGLFSIISIGLACFNMIFDSIWYFYMQRHSRNLQRV